MSAPGCIFLPKPHIAEEKTAAEFGKVSTDSPRRRMEYSGSNAKYHFFAQRRYYYQLGIPTTPSSVVKFYRVPREEIFPILNDFKRTWDMKKWKPADEVITPDEEARLGQISEASVEEVQPSTP